MQFGVLAVGAVILARRRSGIADSREISVTEFLRDKAIEDGSDGSQATMLGSGGPRPR